MTDPPRQPLPGFLFDEHMSTGVVARLDAMGVDAVHVRTVALVATDDHLIFEWARREGRVIVTRNYRDFAPLVAEAARRGLTFPGVLFCARSLQQSDVGAHVRAVERWLDEARAAGVNPVARTFGWLR